MDENKIKPRLLIVGDSFMKPDSSFPGQHWSEMLTDYQVDNRAQDGSTNAMIAERLWSALDSPPDAVVLGFTMSDRLEFDYPPDKPPHNGRKWYTSGATNIQNSDENLACTYYKATVSHSMMDFKGFLIARCMLLTLEKLGIKFAWTLNGLYYHDNTPNREFVDPVLDDLKYCQTPTNLATYPAFKASPGFHVDDPAWQSRFAQEVREILQK
jgi:hypothetical protein